MFDLPDNLPLRAFRLEVSYTASRLAALPETRPLAQDLEEAAQKLKQLEDEEARLDLARVQSEANVETADDAWDDMIHVFERRLLELSGHDTDAPLYRKHFADVPTHVTSLSFHAEILISKALEAALAKEELSELAAFADRLRERREPLESALLERTLIEVDEARFHNRVALAKEIANRLRRTTFTELERIATMRGRGQEWCARFFHGPSAEGASSEAPRGSRLSVVEASRPDGTFRTLRPVPLADSAGEGVDSST